MNPDAAATGTAADAVPTAAARAPRRAVHGVLLLDKPLGWTSQDALAKAKGILRALKGGHTGTLDPLATGLLPLCFGAATKFAQASLDADKRYTATLRLGQRTASADAETPVVEERPLDGVDRAAIERACRALTGPLLQLPPMHSALKHAGRPLYAYARAGVEVERTPRPVVVHALDVLDWQGPVLVLDVRCGKGTYVRTLAEDLGERLGCGAHLTALRRTACGALSIDAAVTIEALAALDPAARDALLLPPDRLLQDRPAVDLDGGEAARFLCGLRRRVALDDSPAVRVYGPADTPRPHARAFLGTAHVTAGELIPDRLLSPPEVRALP